MNGVPRTYDLNKSVLTFGTVNITGYAAGEAATFELEGVDWAMNKGSHGEVSFVAQHNPTGKATVRVMKGNPVNAALAALASTSMLTGASFPLFFVDILGGDQVIAPFCKIEKIPKLSTGDGDYPVEWVFLMAQPEITHGTAIPV
ncbi:MAG: hypothetical protein RBU30_08885 [Polyangia bacterium]|jgi:hypothetical protein|nr:hypothetical protein [Polyangia bacterium]